MATKGTINNKKDAGRYMAFNLGAGKKVIASGSNPATVIKKARGQGVAIPAIIFVPKKNATCLY